MSSIDDDDPRHVLRTLPSFLSRESNRDIECALYSIIHIYRAHIKISVLALLQETELALSW